MTDEDRKTARAMMDYGGSFVKKLGEAAFLADDGNFDRLRNAFPDYFGRYADFSNTQHARFVRCPWLDFAGCGLAWAVTDCDDRGRVVHCPEGIDPNQLAKEVQHGKAE